MTFPGQSKTWLLILMGSTILVCGLGVVPILGFPQQVPEKIDFRRDIYPILSNHCFTCHRGAGASSGYRLDLRSEILGETNGKPLAIPHHSAKSRLIHLVTGQVPGKRMPRKGNPLSPPQIELLKQWIDQGMAWDESLLPATAKTEHWAFQPVLRPTVPKVQNAKWVRNPVDAFIAQGHEAKGLKPSPPASPRILIRRLYLDLIGLPPSPEEIETFEKNPSEQAFREIVERLLASPHYGERWARHWLDLSRWAESEGYESNHLRPYAWRYRDYVVDSFNVDRPFDQFLRQQLAGDEMEPYADENLIATGFLAAARLSSNEEDMFRQRNDMLVDMVNATSSALLGLTIQCAQCHNHKFDPITARDYYRFQGFFIQGQVVNLPLKNPELVKNYEAKKPLAYDAMIQERDAVYEKARRDKIAAVKASLDAKTLKALSLPREQRTAEQEYLYRQADLLFQFTPNQIEAAIPGKDRSRYDDLKKKIADMEKNMIDRPQTFAFYSPATSPHPIAVLPMKGFYPLVYDPKELALAKPYLLAAGDVHKPASLLPIGWPEVFGGGFPDQNRPRSALARWLTDGKNPLTARVYVNRIWQYHFGRGLVATPNDFGVKGTKPTHPELLDWLAAEFMGTGGPSHSQPWSTKNLHRLILLSNTYRQSGNNHEANQQRDPENQYWWRWTPRRMEAEVIRDSLLAVSGELDRQQGGPSLPADKKTSRRSLYLLQKRDLPPQQQALFDGPSAMTESCGKRQTTIVPLQSLYLLNSEFSRERAEALAKKVFQQAGGETSRQIDTAFRLVLGRWPTQRERELANRFFAQTIVSGESTQRPIILVDFCQALMNLNEFIYLE